MLELLAANEPALRAHAGDAEDLTDALDRCAAGTAAVGKLLRATLGSSNSKRVQREREAAARALGQSPPAAAALLQRGEVRLAIGAY